MKKLNLTNKLFDINKLPAQEGILLFPISMSKISNAQSPQTCFKYIEQIINKIEKPVVGLNVIYGDFLYLNSDKPANMLKDKFLSLTSSHKNNFLKILNKNQWYVKKSFSFVTWNQLLLEIKEYSHYLGELKKIYKKDKIFQKYVLEDVKSFGKKGLDTNQLNFILEEILVFYLVTKGKARLQNDFVQDHEKWILFCYPGKPLKSEIYLYQLNPFKLNNLKNKYENSYYDLSDKKIYDYSKIDMNTLDI